MSWFGLDEKQQATQERANNNVPEVRLQLDHLASPMCYQMHQIQAI